MRICARALIIKDKKILLTLDDKGYDFYAIPGGKVEDGENIEQALEREVMEEISVKVKSLKFYSKDEHLNKIYNVKQIDNCYIVEIDGEPQKNNEILEIGWYSKEDIISEKIKMMDHFKNGTFKKLVDEGLL